MEAVSGIVRQPAFVGPHISSIFISSLLTKPPYSSLALCMNSISDCLAPSSGVLGFASFWANVISPCTLRSSLGINDFWFADKYARSPLFLLPNPPFLSPGSPPLLFFMMCSRGQRPATPLHWVALNEEKKRGRKKSCLVLPLMSKSMHLSLKGCKNEGESIGTPRTRPKPSHRSSYHNLWIEAFLP